MNFLCARNIAVLVVIMARLFDLANSSKFLGTLGNGVTVKSEVIEPW